MLALRMVTVFLTLIFSSQSILAQSRVHYNNQDLFLSGSNVAWVNFARDIGPGTTNFKRFSEIFTEIKAAGGNSFRLWLHTTGETTPQFDNTTNLVVGPGSGTLDDLKGILDLAWENEIGLLLCLWSHDMMATSRPAILDRNEKLLTDTTAIRAYIDRALIPMVEAVKGHPGIIAWEIFNEPEGFTEIGNWGDRRHVQQFDVQRFVNLTAGAIHRTDPTAQVTNGTWGMQAQSDVTSLNKVSPEAFYNSLNAEEKLRMERVFETKYRSRLSAKEIIARFYNTSQGNTNFYRDDRLIAAGGDPDGTLDFYTVHYYSWAGTALSPFHNSFSFWNLDKPLALGEFFMEDAFGVPYQNLYETLYQTGYAGALSWQWWGDTQAYDNAKNNNHERTVASLRHMFENYPNDVVVNPKVGSIYVFRASPETIELGESVTLSWTTSAGSTPFLDGVAVAEMASMVVVPDTTTTYTLLTNNEVSDTVQVTVEVLFPGSIYSFSAFPPVVGSGETVHLTWQTTANSTVRLNDVPVAEDDSIAVTVETTTTFKLITGGARSDSAEITIEVLPVDQINRAFLRSATAASGDNPDFITDGNSNTAWRSNSGQGQWAQVTLEEFYIIERVVIKWGAEYPLSYGVVNYNHPVFYQRLYQESNANGGIDTVHVTVQDPIKNLRVLLANNNRYSIREIEIYGVPASITSVNDLAGVVQDFRLFQNYPNPFNPKTTIGFALPTDAHVSLTIYNVLGQQMLKPIDEVRPAGFHTVEWDATRFGSGLYFYRLQTPARTLSKRMLLVK